MAAAKDYIINTLEEIKRRIDEIKECLEKDQAKVCKGKYVLKTTLELTLHCDRPVKSAPDYGRIAIAIKNQLQGLIIELEGGSEVIVEEIRVNQPLAEV